MWQKMYLTDRASIHRDELPYGARDASDAADETAIGVNVLCKLQFDEHDDEQRHAMTEMDTSVSQWTLYLLPDADVQTGDLVRVYSTTGVEILDWADVQAVQKPRPVFGPAQYLTRARLRRIGADNFI